MRILQLITRNQLRGAEVFAAQLSDGLAKRGHQVVLAHLLGQEQVLSTRTDVRQLGLCGDAAGHLPVSRVTWRNLRRLVAEFRPDLIQANGSETLKYAALQRIREKSIPVVYRNISVMSMWAGSGLKQRLVGTALGRMSHVASVTKMGERDLARSFHLPPERVSVIPIGVTLPQPLSDDNRKAFRRSIRTEFGLPSDCPLIVHVGSFTPEKNHPELMEAFSRVLREVPDARLLLIGDGPLRVRIEAEAAVARQTASVAFTGAVANAARIIGGADVLALPSLREGLPGVILEAGAAGVPAVAYDVGGVSEIVEDGATGILVKKGDVAGFAAGLTHVLLGPEVRDRLGETARARVGSEFNLDSIVSRFEALYAALTGNSG